MRRARLLLLPAALAAVSPQPAFATSTPTSTSTSTSTSTPNAAAEPIAVMPWKNLGSAEHAWLSVGMQETLTTDLKRAHTQVVERGRIVEAMRERAADDVVGAAALGKLLGARTLVLGSFQVQGPTVRLSARFVDVATGEVLQATQQTGPLAEVFRLQDEIVAALAPPTSSANSSTRAKPPKKPKSLAPAQVVAYQRFSESLVAPSPQASELLLREALRLDPDFVYAKDALDALAVKVDDAVSAATVAVLNKADAAVAVVADEAVAVDRRVAAARDLVVVLERAHCFRRLLRVSELVLATPALVADPELAEQASAGRILSLARLRQVSLALQAADKHVVQFAGGVSTDAVAAIVKKLVDEQRTLPERRAEYDDELKDAVGDGPVPSFRRCIAAKWSVLPEEMERNCRTFLARYETSTDPDVVPNVRSARAYLAYARGLVGDFASARRLARALEDKDPGALADSGMADVIDATWSRD